MSLTTHRAPAESTSVPPNYHPPNYYSEHGLPARVRSPTPQTLLQSDQPKFPAARTPKTPPGETSTAQQCQARARRIVLGHRRPPRASSRDQTVRMGVHWILGEEQRSRGGPVRAGGTAAYLA
jgi:hypothetical protein